MITAAISSRCRASTDSIASGSFHWATKRSDATMDSTPCDSATGETSPAAPSAPRSRPGVPLLKMTLSAQPS